MSRGVTARPPQLTLSSGGFAAAPVAFLGVFFLWPTLAIVWRGLTGASWSTLPGGRIADAVVTTLALAAAGTVVSLAIGLPAAWALFRRRWPGQRIVVAVLTIPFVLPTVVVASAFRSLLRASPGSWGDSHGAVVVAIIGALAFFNVAVVIRVVGPVWGSLPDGTYHAARTLGASAWRALWEVRLPALGPALAAAAVTVWLFCSASFGVVIVVGGGRIATVDTEIWLQANQFLDLHAAAVLALVQIAMVGTALALGARVKALSQGAGRTAVEPRRMSGGAGTVAVLVALAPAVALLVIPLTGLVERSLRTGSGHGWDHYRALVSSGRVAASGASLYEAALTSVTTALVTGVLATGLAVLTGMAARASHRARWLQGLMLLPLGVSSVVVGLGLLLTLARPILGINLARQGLLLPAAHMIVALPLALAVVLPAMRAVDARLHAAAATLGASPAQVWRLVDWPLTRRAIGMAAGLAAAVSMGEFGATSFLARPGSETLPTLIFRLLGRPGLENMGMAFAASVILALLTAGIMLAADHRLSQVVRG